MNFGFKQAFAALSVSLGLVGCAQALTLDCSNLTDENVAIAVSYMDLDGKTWMVEGWYNIPGGGKGSIELDSNNEVFYIFGEFARGVKVEGGQGGLSLPLYNRTFKYVQGLPQSGADSKAVFVRGVAENGRAEITLGPFR